MQGSPANKKPAKGDDNKKSPRSSRNTSASSSGSTGRNDTGPAAQHGSKQPTNTRKKANNKGHDGTTRKNPTKRNPKPVSAILTIPPKFLKPPALEETLEPTLKVAESKSDDGKTPFTPFVLLLEGLPGSGKSTLAEALVRARPDRYVRICQDELKTRSKCLAALTRVLTTTTTQHGQRQQQRCPIVDRCHGTVEQRQYIVDAVLAAATPATIATTTTIQGAVVPVAPVAIPIDCVTLVVDHEICLARCRQRIEHPTIPPDQADRILGYACRAWKGGPVPNDPRFRDITTIVTSTKNNVENSGAAALKRVYQHYVDAVW